MRGAGGSSGGQGLFIIGFFMFCGGLYMLLNAITFRANYGFGTHIYNFGGVGITSGMIMIPFIFGVGMIFYNAKNIFGWLLAAGSLTALIFGVISQIRFHMQSMSAFDLSVILVLTVGGLGIFLRSLKSN